MNDQAIHTALAVGVPSLAVLVGILINNSRLSDLRSYMDARFAAIDGRLGDFQAINAANLRRVEEVLDARLRLIEERLKLIP